MPFSEPQPQPWMGFEYSAEVTHATVFGTFKCTLRSDNPDYEEQLNTFVQAFVDLVAASEHFAIGNAVKTATTGQTIAPTPPAEPE